MFVLLFSAYGLFLSLLSAIFCKRLPFVAKAIAPLIIKFLKARKISGEGYQFFEHTTTDFSEEFEILPSKSTTLVLN